MDPEAVYYVRTSCARVIGYVDMLVVELDPASRLRRADINEVLSAIQGMPGQEPLLVLLKVPVGVDIDPQTLQGRHDTGSWLRQRIRAFAVVTKNRQFVQVVQLYLAFHRCPVPSAIFHEWPEAAYWVTGMRQAC